jgi:hypothetical protein
LPDVIRSEFPATMIGKAFATAPLGTIAVHFPRLAQEASTAAVLGTLALMVRHSRPLFGKLGADPMIGSRASHMPR